MEDFKTLTYNIFTVWLSVIILFIMVPSMLGFSLGISEVYMKILVKTLEWATLRIQRGFREQKKLRMVASNDETAMEITKAVKQIKWPVQNNENPENVTCWGYLRTRVEKRLSKWTGSRAQKDGGSNKAEQVAVIFLENIVAEECKSQEWLKRILNLLALKRISMYWNCIIQRDESPMEKEIVGLRQSRSQCLQSGDFELSDVFYFSKKGFESIVDDEVTQRFSSEELISWNLLTRTNYNFQYISLRLTTVWVLGVFIRYCILLPLRVTLAIIGISWLVVGATLVGQLPNGRVKDWFSENVHLVCCRICARALSSAIQYHNKENRPKKGGICVANHTSPIDIIILANDGCYAMVGQVHGGLMGVIQRAMARACPHVWFERSEMRDRHLVTKRLRAHALDKEKLPILIFPEGTCINNTSVMMFKKGSFEIGGTIYPVAIKYDPQFGDAFWNSGKYSMVSYLLRMMTSWAINCNVWYLPPMTRKEGEDAVEFANRVKSAIAKQGGLIELPWDGGLKRDKVKDSFKEEQQKNYSKIITGPNNVSQKDNGLVA